MKVARTDLDPRVGDADQRLLEIGIGKTDRLEHRARRRAARACRQRVRLPGHGTTSEELGSQPSCVFQLAYEPSVRSVGANSARWERARAQGSSSRDAARSA